MITDVSLTVLIESHPLLQELLLGWITNFTSQFIKNLSKICTKLRTLAFVQCPQINDDMLGYLGSLPNLENFQLEGNALEAITDEGICNVFTSSIELIRSVTLKGLTAITDKGITTLVHYL
jgi:hypothetical protein